jgi:hypothetical protein
MARERAAAEAAAKHAQRLETAVGIGSVVLTAHGDTWSLILAAADQYTSWPKTSPPLTARSDGMVEVQLSGTHVMMLLHGMDLLAREGASAVDRAVGSRIYNEVARTVDAVDSISRPGDPVTPIVLDARLANPES